MGKVITQENVEFYVNPYKPKEKRRKMLGRDPIEGLP
jgi:hypothetical protein